MDTRYFRSKEFVIAAAVAVMLIAGAVIASGALIGSEVLTSTGCTVREPTGQLLDTDHRDTGAIQEDDRTRRQVSWTLTPPPGDGILRLCTEVGDVDIVPTDGDELRVEFTIVNRGPGAEQAVEDLDVRALFAQDGDQLEMGAWQASQTRTEGFFERQTTQASLEILLPADHAYALEVATDVGDIHLAGPTLATADLTTDVGDIGGTILELRGGLTAETDVGDIVTTVSSARSGSWQVTTDVGDVELTLPAGETIGYDVSAEADVGSVSLDIGPTERSTSEREGASESARARSEGYAERTDQVRLTAITDVGDVDIEVR